MRWRRRYAKFILAGAAVAWAAWRYLLPGLLAGPVAARLEAAYGAPVRLDAVHVGWGGTSLRGLKLYEAGAGPGDAPWAEAAEVRTDVTPWRALTGRAAPRDVTLEDAAVLLRFDRAGGLLTRLPDGGGGGADLPVIRLRRGRLTVRQDGRANDLVVHGITAEARSDDGRLVLEGAAADPTWGAWAASGGRDRAGALRATFTADRVNVTPARLMELPLIPPALWEQVQGEGETAVECTVQVHPGVSGVSLRVALTPRLMTVRLPTLGLTVDRAKGAVVYEDGVVRLRGAECVLAGGRLGVEGELDLRAAGSDADIRLALDAADVDVRRLPAAWSMPARLEGRVTGRADVRVTRAGDRTRVAGTGGGHLRGVPIGGRPAAVALALREEAPPGSAAPAACCLVAELDEGDADLGRLVEEAGIEPPFPITGRLALRVRLAVPLDTLGDPQTFRVQATAEAPRVACGDIALEGITARIRYDGGVLRLDECGGTVPRPPGYRPQTPGRAVLEGVRIRVGCAGGIAEPNEFCAAPAGSVTGSGFRPTAGAGTFRLEGAADLRRPTRGEAVLEAVRERTAFAVGLLQKDAFRGMVPRPAAADGGPGRVLPQALSARLTLDAIPLSLLAPPEPGDAPAVDGTLSASMNARAPVARLDRAGAWSGGGTVTAHAIRAGRAAPGSARADLDLRRGVLSVTDLDGRLGGAVVTGRGDVEVGAPWRFRATLGLAADLAALRQLNPAWPPDPAVAGRAAATALVTGSLSPFRVEGAGDGTGTGLEVGGVPVAGFRFRWHADAARLAVRDVRAEVFGGHLSGEGEIPLRATEPGRLDLHARDVDVPTLAAAVPDNTFRPAGRVSGRARAVLGAAGPGGDRPLAVGFDIQTPAATADGAVEYRAGTLAYRLDGAALGGRFHLDGRVTPADAGTADRPPDGCLRLDGLDLGRLCGLLGVQAAAGPFGGTAGAEIRFRHHGPDHRPVGLGSVAVRRLRWGEVELAPEVKAAVRLTPVGVELAEVTGAVCGGEFKGQAALDWGAASGRIDLSLTGADASRVLAPWPALAGQVRGPLAAHVRVTPGAEWKAVGRLTLRRGRVAGVEVTELELPIEAGHTPALGQGWVEVRESTAQVALGRAVGRASCRWGAGTQVEGAVRFSGLDLRHLLPAAAGERVVAGLLSGRVEVRGTDVRTLDDVAGSLDCTLRQTTALAFPVLRDLVPFVGPAGSERTVFDTGECRARLARGVVRVERLALVGPTVRLALDGTAGPDDRLGLNVAVHTGRLGVAPDAPVAVRLIRLRVDGTVPRPLVQVGP